MSLKQDEILVKALEKIDENLSLIWHTLDLLVLEFRKRELAYEKIVKSLTGCEEIKQEGTD